MIKKLALKLKLNKFTIIASVVLFLIVSISLGSAFLKSTLSINGNSTIKKSSWIIYFDDVEKSIDSVESENDAKIVDRAKTRIEFEADLKQPGDFYEFTVYTVNDGSIDAMVESIDKFELTDEQKAYLDFDVTYDNGDPILPCDPLDAGTRRWIKAIVKFKDHLPLEDYPTEDVHLELFFNINYVQKQNTCTPEPRKNQHVLTIKPKGGVYANRLADTRIYLEKNETYTVAMPTRELYNFKGWTVTSPEENGTYDFTNDVFTMGDEDVTIEATWEEGDYVARIMTTYYPTIQDAFDAAKHADFADNTVYLLKDTTEYPVNNTTDDFVFNLGGHTVNGTITNSAAGNIALTNGRVVARTEDKEAFINYGHLDLGLNDGFVYVENSIALIGNAVGLTNKDGSEFYFYDGYIEGLSGLVGGYTDKAENYYVFADHNDERNCQRVYLVRNPSRAVARTSTPYTKDVYYYNLQDAFISAKLNKEALTPDLDSNFIVYAHRNFEAPYEIEIPENSRLFFDTMGHTVSIGNTVTNNGYFKILSSAEDDGKLKTSFTIINNGVMDIDDVDLVATTDSNVIQNNNTLNLDDTEITSKGGYGIYNNTDAVITFTEDTLIDSTGNYGLYNKSDNLVVDDGTIYGLYNTGSIVLDENTKLHVYKIDDRNYIPAITNTGTITMNAGEISTNYDTTMIYNRGTITVNDGTISSQTTGISNYYDGYGTVNANGGLITSQGNAISSGTVNVNNNGEIKSVNGIAISGATVNVYAGDVYSDNDTAISCGGQTVNVYGGLVKGENIGISSCNVNISAGEITGKNYGVYSNNSLTVTGGKVTSESRAVSVSSATISGGEVLSANDALVTTNLNISGGKVHSSEANAITVMGTGTITGSETDIYGENYGVYNKGSLTIGSFEDTDEDEPEDYPVIIGGAYGLYIDGPVTNFYDGILKGQVDGYEGRITGLPLACVGGEGEEEIDGNLYQTDFIVHYENWLKVGDTEYNSIDAASKAIGEGETGTITVIKDADLVFTQHFVDNGTEETGYKHITFDLNGHTITSTQTIYNDSDVTIVDDSNLGTIKPTRIAGITNRNKLTIEAGNYLSEVVDEVIINESGLLTINNAYFNVNKYAITNDANLVINDINIEESFAGINNRGNTTVHGGTITGSDMGISSPYNYNVGTVYVDGGTIFGENYGIGGAGATIHVDGGSVEANAHNALYSYYGSITVSNGEVKSNNSVAVVTAQVTNVSGGEVTGTMGIEHICYYSGWGGCYYHDINITGGKVKGTDSYGIHAIGAKLSIHAGEIIGEVDGVYTSTETQIGDDEKNVSIESPSLTGKRYGLNTTAYTKFFDGVLQGMEEPHNGLIGLIPDAYMIKDDYTYIDRDYYKTQYLVPVGNWLRVNGVEYNTLTNATAAIDSEGTIEVIADAYVDYEQELPYGKIITFDLNGHSVIMTQPLQTKGTNTIKDSVGNGGITNIRSNGNADGYNTAAVYNTGTLTIEGGTYNADQDYAINNGGTLTIDNLTINNYGGVYSSGTLTINGGTIEGTDTYSLDSWGTTTINGGTITSNVANSNAVAIQDGTTTINDGTITSTVGTAVSVTKGSYYALGHVVINGGTITGKTNGVANTNSGNTILITGGIITGEDNNGLNTSSDNCVITGGSIIGGAYGVYTTGTTILGVVEDNSIDITQPMIQGTFYGLYIDGGTTNFYDGILKGTTEAEYGIISNIPPHAQIFPDTEIIDGETYKVKYLIMESVIAYNRETGVEYTNLQEAINDADTDQTVVLVANVPLYYSVTNNNTKHFNLDLHGYTISTNKTITNNGNITLINDSENEANIKTSSAINLINNNGTLNINNIKLTNVSSSNYIINNTSNLVINNSRMNAINAIYNTNSLDITSSNIVASKIAINNTKNVTITGGNYSGENYSIYSNDNSQATVTVVGNGINTVLDGNIESIRTTLDVTDTNIIIGSNGSISNSSNSIATFERVNVTNTNGGSISNSATMTINNSNINLGSPQNYNYSDTYVAIYNSGTMDINNTNIKVDETNTYKYYVKGISNTGSLTLENESSLTVGHAEQKTGKYYGIETSGSGNTLIDNSEINAVGSAENYGVYMVTANAQTTLLTGSINVSDAPTTYGAYINPGTFIMGHYDNSVDNVSQENPVIHSIGTTKGIGVDKENGSFNFYDGVIWASRFAKVGTTTLVEKDQEVTTYVDEETSYEYAWLENIKNDYGGQTVAVYRETYYSSLQLAINAYDEELGGVITLLKPISDETEIEVASGRKAVVNLGGYSITAKVTNNGTLDIYNGTIMNFDDYAVVNNGTFNMGQNDEAVSSVSIRIISENIAVQNNNTFNMYDGYIEGSQAMEGEITSIANLARVVTKHEEQSERKYLQSLSIDDIIAGNTDLYLTIDPKSGYYKGSKEVRLVYLKHGEPYLLIDNPSELEKHACTFNHWEASEAGILDGNTVTMNLSDATVTAVWTVNDDAVAKIGDEYYVSIAEALAAANENDTIELIKDTTENVTNNKNVTFNLGGHTLTGAFINNGIMILLNGTINNPDGTGLVNNKTLTMGVNDGTIETEAIAIIGSTVALEQNGSFNFYDGYLQGQFTLNGGVNSLPRGYTFYTEPVIGTIYQRSFLNGNPANAVAIIENGGENVQYFFNLQNAIDTANYMGKPVNIVRDFEASYAIEIREDYDIEINMQSYNITTGSPITNNGTLRIYDISENPGSITSASPITNDGELTIENIILKQVTNSNTINNNGTLNITNSSIEAKNGYAVNNVGTFTMDNDSYLKSDTYALLSNHEDYVISGGNIQGIEVAKNVTIGDTNIIDNGQRASIQFTNANTTATLDGTTINSYNALTCNKDNSKFVVNEADINATNVGIRLENTNCQLEVNDSSITAVNEAIRTLGYNTKVSIDGSNITSTGTYGYFSDSYKSPRGTIKITDSVITGVSSAVRVYYDNLTVSGTDMIVTGSGNDKYVLYCYSESDCNITNSTMTAENASGVYAYSSVTLTDVEINANANNSFGINDERGNLNINGDTIINTPGGSAYGIYRYSNPGYYGQSYNTITINDVDIKSGNVGIYMFSGQSYSTTTLVMNNGSVVGDTYGIHAASSTVYVTIGNPNAENDIYDPYVSGGLFGLYKNGGTSNFYSGRLRGLSGGYNQDFNALRAAKEITSEHENTSENLTIVTNNVSDEAISEYAKMNNGYAKITYLGETIEGVCEQNSVTSFTEPGEAPFSAPCAGLYKIEVWGAQGGSYSESIRGGYGSYATGEIELSIGETLYVNVGGAGTIGYDNNTTIPGGYNGGGDAVMLYPSTRFYSGSGGGATHVATTSGELSTLENNKEAILIVAGGGGGSGYWSSSEYGSGGDAGGYRAADGVPSPSYPQYYGTGATVNRPGYFAYNNNLGNGSFGKGGSPESTISNKIMGGAGGGGYYGGGAAGNNYATAGGGGSGYNNNSRLSNKVMYTYSDYGNSMTVNYLVNKEAFLIYNGTEYNSLEAAIGDVEDTGTIYVFKNASLQELATVPSENNITLDLQGHTLTMTQPITNEGTLTIMNEPGLTGKIDNKASDAIINKGTLVIDNASIKSTNYAIRGNAGTGTITLQNNPTIEGYNGIYVDSAQKVIMNNGTINTTGVGVYLNAQNSEFEMKNGEISTGSESIRLVGYNTKLTVENGTVTSTNNSAIYSDSYKNPKGTINITGGTFTGGTHTIRSQYDNLTISGSDTKVISTATNRDNYAIYCSSDSNCIISDITITADNASGIYKYAPVTLTDVTINAGASNGFGINDERGYLEINGNTVINTPGSNAFGIYRYSSPSYYSQSYETITINDIEITSGNVGVYMYSYPSYSSTTLNMNNGSITGKNYGIQQTSSTVYTTIGNLNNENDIYDPYVSGGTYGIYKEAGTANFYSGRLRGSSAGYNSDFSSTREAYDIATVQESSSVTGNIITNSTEEVSEDPVSKKAKQGNGYAKITFIAEDETETFSFTNGEQTFNVTETGTYELEVWGAQGGSPNGGYGGYSTCKINLTAGDTLYINVGGQGVGSTGGYNGGGNSTGDNYYAGGGATHIAKSSGLLTTFENNRDDIIIVAGGGGGGSYGSYNAQGGSGGGNEGGHGGQSKPSLTKLAGGGTQTAGGAAGEGTYNNGAAGSFGKGANGTDYSSGGGGGYYGGGSSGVNSDIAGSGGGGSGYIKDVNIISGEMYGYQIPTDIWIVNYLVPKEAFLIVNGDEYNSFTAAIGAIEDTGTILVKSSAFVQSGATIPSSKNITINMNGKTLTMTQPLVNEGTLTIYDNGSGLLDNTITNTIENKGIMVLDGAHLKSAGSSIYGSSGTGTITLQNNPTFEGYRGIYLDSAQKIIMNNGSFDLTNVAIYLNGQNSELEMKDGSIQTTAESIRLAGYGTKVKVEDGTITSTNSSAIYSDSYKNPKGTITITGGTFTGGEHTIRSQYDNLTISGSDTEVITTATNRDYYAIYCTSESNCNISDITITADNASGIYKYAPVTLTDVTINAGASNAFGINDERGYLEINGNTIITTPGADAYGIYRYSSPGYYSQSHETININGGEITSGNVGVYMYSYPAYSSTTLNLNKGTIIAPIYGIQQASETIYVTIGNLEDENDITDPYVNGGLFGIYSSNASVNIYSGHIIGTNEAVNSIISNVRSGYEIFESNAGEISLDNQKYRTYSTTSVSEDPISHYAKMNNGYAKITYVGETVEGVCEQNHEYSYLPENAENTFTVPCTGTYRLEAWGAQGGGSNGGYGGYSEGYIDLTAGETLYINVGGVGTQYDGGYNGGGNGGSGGGQWSYGGGGATHIATASGLLSTLESNKDAIIIVAAGGGGAGGSSTTSPGGNAGGYKGNSGYDGYNNSYTSYNGTGATQTSGGKLANGSCGYGSFGQGSNFCNSGYGGAGGGGGYYGGGGSNRGHGGAGGGSGYIANPNLYNKRMYGYEVEPIYASEFIKEIYLVLEQPFIIDSSNPSEPRSNLQTAIDLADDGATLEFNADANLSYAVTIPTGKTITIDLHGHNLNMTKSITNNGTLVITNLDTNNDSKLSNSLSVTALINKDNLTISNIELENYNAVDNDENGVLTITYATNISRNQAIINSGKYTISDSTVKGSNYVIYDNSTKTNTISDSILQGTNSIYINSTPNVTITDTEITGNINNTKTNGTLSISNTNIKDIKGTISNTGTTTIKKANITHSYGNYSEFNMISNSGILTLNNNTVVFTDTYSGTNNYVRIISNSGTLNTTGNDYTLNRTYENGTYYYRYEAGIYNTAILTSNGDTFTMNKAERMYAILDNSSNSSTISNIEININRANNAFGIYADNTNSNITVDGGEFNSTDSVNTYGVYVDKGTLVTRNADYHVNGTTSAYGAFVNNGSYTIETGNIYAHAATAYGVRIDDNSTSGSITLGIKENTGFDSTTTSTIDPYIEAIGTTTGYGISRGNGAFNFYDGKFTGSTNARTAGSATSDTERNYQIKIVPAVDDQYEYCILEFMM